MKQQMAETNTWVITAGKEDESKAHAILWQRKERKRTVDGLKIMVIQNWKMPSMLLSWYITILWLYAMVHSTSTLLSLRKESSLKKLSVINFYWWVSPLFFFWERNCRFWRFPVSYVETVQTSSHTLLLPSSGWMRWNKESHYIGYAVGVRLVPSCWLAPYSIPSAFLPYVLGHGPIY